MPKRKREAQNETTRIHHSDDGGDHRLSPKIHHCRKLLQRSFKLAKGFERQKLGRRRKIAVQEQANKSTLRIDQEIEALKTLDLAIVAETHLYRIIERDQGLGSSNGLLKASEGRALPTSHVALVNVVARLYNSNPVKETDKAVLDLLRDACGKRGGQEDRGSSTSTRIGKSNPSNGTGSLAEDETRSEMSWGLSSEDPCLSGVDERVTHLLDSKDHQNLPDLDDDEELNALEDQMIGSSSESGDDEDDTVDEPQATARYDHAGNLSLSPSPSGSESDTFISRPQHQAQENKSSKAASAFVPSLSMGGYWSGTESEASDVDDPRRRGGSERKNRRGQRARQQIWEKKFGSKAKHVSKNGPVRRDAGWDPKRGATAGERGKGYRPGWARGKLKRNPGLASGGNAIAITSRKPKAAQKQNGKGLHPSWEAARKAKERAGSNAPAFAGSKMTFD